MDYLNNMLNINHLGYDIEAFRKKFQEQPDFEIESHSLFIPEDGNFDSPNFNSSFVPFIFLGRNGQYLINEVDWEFGVVEKEFLGLKLLEDMQKELNYISAISTKQQIQWRMNNVVRPITNLTNPLTWLTDHKHLQVKRTEWYFYLSFTKNIRQSF